MQQSIPAKETMQEGFQPKKNVKNPITGSRKQPGV